MFSLLNLQQRNDAMDLAETQIEEYTFATDKVFVLVAPPCAYLPHLSDCPRT